MIIISTSVQKYQYCDLLNEIFTWPLQKEEGDIEDMWNE